MSGEVEQFVAWAHERHLINGADVSAAELNVVESLAAMFAEERGWLRAPERGVSPMERRARFELIVGEGHQDQVPHEAVRRHPSMAGRSRKIFLNGAPTN